MTNQREKGNRYEREIIIEINELNSDYKVGSSRYLSTYMDSKLVDVVDYPDCIKRFPFHIQCKSLSNRVPYEHIFAEFELKDKPLVIFHKLTKKSTKNFMTVGEFVIMKKADFYELIKT